MNSYFYQQVEKNSKNVSLLEILENYSMNQKKTVYVLNRPLTDQKYSYDYSQAIIVLTPKTKITIINCGSAEDDFEEYVEDIIEDIGSISDKYDYKSIVGRPRKWRKTLVESTIKLDSIISIDDLIGQTSLQDEKEIKKIDLLISLFIGSINDVSRVKEDVPQTLLDKVKQKIQLFDGDQTRFIYQSPENKIIRIQGLSGTGKTELLLHKLKELYTNSNSKIFFTCHNKILAHYLRIRIPSFFNFMRVEEQIEWEKRFWCRNAWGSRINSNSGAYRYICNFYDIPFYTYSPKRTFSDVCETAINDIKNNYKGEEIPFAFTYMLIDESQDFDKNFIELCKLVTEKNVYVAGDIFQSIFDENISSTIEPDFLLGKCYRTDPKTLMFAHALGMGLFEETKLRWLEEKEWRDCGYNVEIKNSKYYLSREALRRFEDIDDDYESIKIINHYKKLSDGIVELIKEIRNENPTVQPDDIGLIMLDLDNYIYRLADILEVKIQKTFGWSVNKAYESKEKQPNTILISNKNNIKGLEFPFVICITSEINTNLSYRNSLYTMLTRSFLKSYLLMPNSQKGLTQGMENGLKNIMAKKQMIIDEPSVEEKEKIRTRFKYSLKKLSFYDRMSIIIKKLKIDKTHLQTLINMAKHIEGIYEADDETLISFARENLKYLKK